MINRESDKTNIIRDFDALKEEREILHSQAFRRLKGKTQVRPSTEQNIHVTERLSHSLEVGVNARLILALFQHKYQHVFPINPIQLNNICKLHDIGHPPMGHTFEKVANKVLKSQKIYFEGNANNIKIIEKDKINLSMKTIVSLIKYPTQINEYQTKGLYTSQYKKYIPELISEIKSQYLELKRRGITSKKGEKFLLKLEKLSEVDDKMKFYKKLLKKTKMRLAETIIMEEADDITYLTHDLKDFYMYIAKKGVPLKIDDKYKNNKYVSKIKNINSQNVDKIIMELRDILIEDLYFDFDSFKIKYQTSEIKELKNFLYYFTTSQYIIDANNLIHSIINLEEYLNYMMSNIDNEEFIMEFIHSTSYQSALLNAPNTTAKKRLMINFIAEKTDAWLLEDYNLHKKYF